MFAYLKDKVKQKEETKSGASGQRRHSTKNQEKATGAHLPKGAKLHAIKEPVQEMSKCHQNTTNFN